MFHVLGVRAATKLQACFAISIGQELVGEIAVFVKCLPADLAAGPGRIGFKKMNNNK